ncbi:MAG: hypothetical protein JJU15_16315 [Pararhodobacter sp.]|nr:hypothetical protein [Pararhodobacter sp.]
MPLPAPAALAPFAPLRACLFALAFAAPVAVVPVMLSAQVIEDCGWVSSPAHITEPWDENSRSFANGAVRVARLDTGGEPVCCAVHLLILSPAPEGPHRQCHTASPASGRGFFDIDFSGISASYDPAQGLLVSVPVFHWHSGVETGAGGIPDRMEILVNQATGAVTAD